MSSVRVCAYNRLQTHLLRSYSFLENYWLCHVQGVLSRFVGLDDVSSDAKADSNLAEKTRCSGSYDFFCMVLSLSALEVSISVSNRFRS